MTPTTFATLDDLRGATGRHLGWTDWLDITQERVNRFAEATGDHQWIHVDVERANAESPFGGPIAHGFLTLALVPKLNPASVHIVGHGNATNYGSEGLRFLAPVPSGSKVHAHDRLISAVARPNGTLITTEIAVHVIGAEKPSLLYKMQILYMPKR